MRKLVCIIVFVALLCSGAQADEPPVLSPIPDQRPMVGELFTYYVDATGDPAPTYSLGRAPNGMTIDSVTGVIEWTPTLDQTGSQGVTVIATNSAGSDEVIMHIGVPLVPPEMASIPDVTVMVAEEWKYRVELVAGSPNPGPTYSLPVRPDGMTMTGNSIHWTPTVVQVGANPVTVKVANSSGSDTKSFVVNVEAGTEPRTFSLRALSQGSGSVTSPGEGNFYYAEGTQVSITASPETGSHFLVWRGSAVTAGKVGDPLSSTTTLTMHADYTIEAIFHSDTEEWHELSIYHPSGGNVIRPSEGSHEYRHGSIITLNARPYEGYRFVRWGGSAVDAGKVADVTAAETTLTMDADYTLTAYFTLGTETVCILTASAGAGGSVSTPGEGSFEYDEGTSVSISAQVDEGYEFSGWTGTAVDADKVASPTSASTTVTMDADYTLRANFDVIHVVQRTLTISSGVGGSVSTPGTGAFEYDEETSVSISAQVDEGYEFSGWTGTGVDAGKVASPASASTTVTMDADYALHANFAEVPALPWTLTVSCGRGGTVLNPGTGTFSYGDGEQVLLEAQPDSLYRFSHWSGSVFTTASTTSVSMNSDNHVQANFVSVLDEIHVDDDASGDPAPCDAGVSHPNENGTAAYPFDAIQEAIEVADEHTVIHVHSGTYFENIDFLGKRLRLTGLAGRDPGIAAYPVLDGGDLDTVVTFASGEDANCVLEGFVITRGRGLRAGAVHCLNSDPMVTNCLIVGNRASHSDGAAVYCVDSNIVLVNCTISGNYGGQQGAGLYFGDSHAVMANSIVRDNLPTEILVGLGAEVSVVYSDVAGGWPGLGNIDVDPLFALPGYWGDSADPTLAVEPDSLDAIWIDGDYHLMSHAGRWDQDIPDWVLDTDTSLCIDAGDPLGGVGEELVPHGDIVNMGAYGGTMQASKSP